MHSPGTPMTDSTCLVTGATGGIGFVTALELARLGATVVVAGRSPERCAASIGTIRAATGNQRVTSLCADLASQSDVRRLAREFLADHGRLDVLVNNAGAVFAVRRESVDGVEMTLAVNHLAPFLLTTLLLPVIEATPGARIINISSDAQKDVPGFNFDDPQARRGGLGGYPRSEWASVVYSLAAPWAHPGFLQYARTKVANILFTTELARRLAGAGVSANAVHPGLVVTGLSSGNGVYGWCMRRFVGLRGISAEEGAAPLLRLATAAEVSGVTGAYFVGNERATPSPGASDPDAAGRLWALSEALTSGPSGAATRA